MDYIIVVVFLVLSALFSGLTLGLMSLNSHELKRKMDLGNKNAKKVYQVRKKGNLLLCTLLVGNVAVNAILSIFLSSLMAGSLAVVVSTALIVIFGEIVPQSIFSRYALMLGAKTAWLVKILIFIFYPICYPIAKVLDKTLGDELPTIYSKQELVRIIEEHEDSKDSTVKEEEERIVKGALTFSDKLVEDVMTPRTVVRAVEADMVITASVLNDLSESAHSRLLVFGKDLDDIIGIAYLKHLIGDTYKGKTFKDASDHHVIFVNEKRKLLDVLNAFLSTRHHLFVVIDEFGSVVGIVTLEDILEEIIGAEIMDEDDKHQDLRLVARQKLKRDNNEHTRNVV